MKDSLKKLIQRREAAYQEYEAFVQPIIDEGRVLTADEETKRTELRGKFEAFDTRIDEVNAQEARQSELDAARERLGTPDVKVTAEPTVYGEGSPNSYFADLVRASNPLFHTHREAVARLNKASHEAEVEMASGKPKTQRSIEAILRAEHRDDHGTARDRVKEARERGRAAMPAEVRTGMNTTATSGGSFSTPVYFVQKYAPYREAGRAFADQVTKNPLPEYGMEVYIPHVTGPAGVATQATQNTGVQETDPTAGYLSAGLKTQAGEVTVSQQLLDRAGPSFQFDKLVFDQLQRDYAPKLDTLVLTQALATAGTVLYTVTTGFALTATNGVGGFFGYVSNAKANVRTTAGVIMNPTHLFLQPDRWEYMSAWADSQGRPVVVPDYAGPFNAIAGGSRDGDSGVEGATGYRFNGLPVFQDLNIPAPAATHGNDQAIVGNLSEVWLFEGDVIPRVIPQTFAQNLSVLLQIYAYVAVIVRYPKAVQVINGKGMAAITF